MTMRRGLRERREDTLKESLQEWRRVKEKDFQGNLRATFRVEKIVEASLHNCYYFNIRVQLF